MILVTITCPITWYKQIDWIKLNCKNYLDHTNWAAWQIGLDDIHFYLEDKDATWFKLIWSQ